MLYTKPDSIVWGTGCIAPGRIGQTPKKIYAVRGPLTKKELDKRGISCPEIYGDPALLFPQIYNPKIEKKYKLGIIPHYIDYFSNIDKQIIKNLAKRILSSVVGTLDFIITLFKYFYINGMNLLKKSICSYFGYSILVFLCINLYSNLVFFLLMVKQKLY